jgi:hypothetical protein
LERITVDHDGRFDRCAALGSLPRQEYSMGIGRR